MNSLACDLKHRRSSGPAAKRAACLSGTNIRLFFFSTVVEKKNFQAKTWKCRTEAGRAGATEGTIQAENVRRSRSDAWACGFFGLVVGVGEALQA